MDDEHYIDGDHNDGVFNHYNHNVYGYCYQNPIILVDPNGKQNVPGAIIGAAVGGLFELGGQLLSGKSLGEVDWADVAIESGKGALIGFNPVLGTMAANAIGSTAKAAVDVTYDEGVKDVFGISGNKKSKTEFIFDATTDFIGGELGGLAAKKLGKMADKQVKEATKKEVKALKEVRNATVKYNKVTKGGTKNLNSEASKKASKKLDIAQGASNVARTNVAKAKTKQMISRQGQPVNEGIQNVIIDKTKEKLDKIQ